MTSGLAIVTSRDASRLLSDIVRCRGNLGYTQRWQSETVHSMMKRTLGSELRGKTAWSQKRDMALKALTHDLMVFRTGSRQSRHAATPHPERMKRAAGLIHII
jgi:hypothetical protein